jgi:hypothetical protein
LLFFQTIALSIAGAVVYNQTVDFLETTDSATGNTVDFVAGEQDCRDAALGCRYCIGLANYTTRTISSDSSQGNFSVGEDVELGSGCMTLFLHDCATSSDTITLGCFEDIPTNTCGR